MWNHILEIIIACASATTNIGIYLLHLKVKGKSTKNITKKMNKLTKKLEKIKEMQE